MHDGCHQRFKKLESDIKELKLHNKWQDEEYRSMNKYMQNISEAIVEMKVMNENTNKLLINNAEKVEAINDKIDRKIETTDRKIDNVKESFVKETMKHHYDLRLLIKQWLPPLILLGLYQLIINIL